MGWQGSFCTGTAGCGASACSVPAQRTAGNGASCPSQASWATSPGQFHQPPPEGCLECLGGYDPGIFIPACLASSLHTTGQFWSILHITCSLCASFALLQHEGQQCLCVYLPPRDKITTTAVQELLSDLRVHPMSANLLYHGSKGIGRHHLPHQQYPASAQSNLVSHQRVVHCQVRRTQAGAAGTIQLRIVSRLQNQAMSNAWESWSHFHRQHKACKAIASRIRNRGMAGAFNAWKDRAVQLTRAKLLCQRVLGGSLRRCFSAWE